MPNLAAKPLIQNGRIVLDPAPDRDVVHRQIPLRHHLLQISIAEGVSQIPANAQKDDHVLEMSSPEQHWPILGHRITLPNPSAKFATDPRREDHAPSHRPQMSS